MGTAIWDQQRAYEQRRREIEALVRRFFKEAQSGTSELFEKAARKVGDDSIIQAFLQGESKSPEVKGIEIEAKLDIPKIARTNNVSFLMKDKLVQRWIDDRFVWQSYGTAVTTINCFYGTNNGEVFSFIDAPEAYVIKEKSGASPYKFGIPNEEYVLRRPESLKEIVSKKQESPSRINIPVPVAMANVLREKEQETGATYRGTMQKKKFTTFLIERGQGRIYAATLAHCIAEGRDPLLQLEFEFAGSIPNFPGQRNPNDEKGIVEDLTYLLDHMQMAKELTPTRQTKYDWVVGRVTP